MKKSEVLAAAIAEATSIPITAVEAIVAQVIAQIPTAQRGQLDEDMDKDEALRLLSIFRQNQHGIRQWLREGYQEAVADGQPPFIRKSGHASHRH